jgi:hypothetical protein
MGAAMADEAFDMFTVEPFREKLLRAASGVPVDPVTAYAALVVGVSIESIVIAELLSGGEEEVSEGATADAMKFVIMNLQDATEEELSEIVGAVVGAAGGDATRILTDPASLVSGAYEEESEDGDEEDGSDDEIDGESLAESVREKIAGWDDWEPSDEILSGLKSSFATACASAMSATPSDDF